MAWMKRCESLDNDLTFHNFSSRNTLTSTPLHKRSSSAEFLDCHEDHRTDGSPSRLYSPRGSLVPGYESSRYKSPARGPHDNERAARYSASNSGYVSDSGTTTSSRFRSNPGSGDELEPSSSSSRFGSNQELYKNKKSGNYIYGGRQERRVSEESRRSDDRYKKEKEKKTSEPKRHESWAYIDAHCSTDVPPCLHTSASYADFEANSSTSGSLFIPRVRTVHSAPASAIDTTEIRKPRQKREDSSVETGTSGYSTNSLSEMSEFTSTSHHGRENNRKYKQNPAHRKGHADYDRNRDQDRFHNESETKYGQRTSKEEKNNALNSSHRRSDSKLSINGSDVSGSSKDKQKSAKRDSKGSSNSLDSKVHIDSKTSSQKELTSIGNVSVTVTNNIRYDPNDPFSFIQPVDLPFHLKIKKCAGPIMAVLLLIILAGALGAAIFFASAYSDKKNLEAKVDLLEANLAVKIRSSGYTQNIDNLSSAEFQDVSNNYCKQMDMFYSKSQFQQTYRGCEVISIKDRAINFTLFFVEKEATKSQIVAVIETSATRLENATSSVALVDKFELELDSVKLTIERRLEPETFNKKFEVAMITTAAPPKTIKITSVGDFETKRTSLRPTATPTEAVNRQSAKKTPPANEPVYLWDPCQEYEGAYFPHPTRCDQYFHCSNGVSVLQTCSKELLYHWKELTCVSKYTSVRCPDASKAPPRPSTTVKPTTKSVTIELTTKLVPDVKMGEVADTGMKSATEPSIKSLTGIAGRYKGRTDYTYDPCTRDADFNLYPHPDDCGKFIQCVNGRAMTMNCSENLVFFPNGSTCIIPPNKELVCPDIHPCKDLNDGYFPHPYNCSKFIQCQNGTERIQACAQGLVWSESVKSCLHVAGQCNPPVRS